MGATRWSKHAIENLAEREIDRAEVEAALANPELIVPDDPGREVVMRRYFDQVLGQEMLLRVVVERTADETVIVTVYKTSQIKRYLREIWS